MTDIAELGLVVRSDGVVVAKDRLKGMTTQAELADKVVGRLISTAGKLVGAYSTWRIAEAIVSKFVRSTIEAEKVSAQLTATIRSTGAAAGYSTNELLKMASGLQKLTAYDDEAIAGAQGLLLTFTRIGRETFPDALKAVLDLSTAMGTDLRGASVQIGKALNDPIQGLTALTRIGVAFDAQQKQMIKTMVESGRTADAQKIILAELRREFGDSAKAARGTLGGALSALQNAFDDLFEANGPASETLRKAVEGLVTKLSDPTFIQSVQNFGATLFNAISQVIPVIQQIMDFLNRLGGTVKMNDANDPLLTRPISSINSELDNYKKLRSLIGDASGSDIGSLFGQGPDVRRKYYDDQISKLQGELNARKRRGPYDNVESGIGGWADFQDQFNPTKPGKPPAIITDDMIAAQEKLAQAYKNITSSARQQIAANQLQISTLGLTSEQTARLTNEQTLLNKAANDNIKLTPQQVSELQGLAAEMARTEEVARQLNETYEFGKSTLNGFFSDIKSNLMQGVSLWDAFANAASNAFGRIADKALGLAADGIWDMIFGAFKGSMGGGIGSAFSGGWGSTAFLNANGNAFKRGITGHVNEVVSKPTLFPFAKGVGMMGEAGAEAIMPLRRNSSGQLGVMAANQNSGGINLYFGDIILGGGNTEEAADEFVRRVMKSLNENFPGAVLDVVKNPRARGKRYFSVKAS